MEWGGQAELCSLQGQQRVTLYEVVETVHIMFTFHSHHNSSSLICHPYPWHQSSSLPSISFNALWPVMHEAASLMQRWKRRSLYAPHNDITVSMYCTYVCVYVCMCCDDASVLIRQGMWLKSKTTFTREGIYWPPPDKSERCRQLYGCRPGSWVWPGRREWDVTRLLCVRTFVHRKEW